MNEQPIPEHAACPNCGGEPEDDPEHNLRALGYTHDDIVFKCRDCGKEWTAGCPIGSADSMDLRCDACWKSDEVEVYGRSNWIRYQDEERFAIAVKCPRCLHVWSIFREATNGAAMVGDPVIAGNMDDAEQPFTERS